jgi:hypothetical protein
VLDWWATAIDREAKPRSEMERQGVYQRIRNRMDEELRRIRKRVAVYWNAAAARIAGRSSAAWDAAQAGRVARAPSRAYKGTDAGRSRDRLVRDDRPDRARRRRSRRIFWRASWERFKESWR